MSRTGNYNPKLLYAKFHEREVDQPTFLLTERTEPCDTTMYFYLARFIAEQDHKWPYVIEKLEWHSGKGTATIKARIRK